MKALKMEGKNSRKPEERTGEDTREPEGGTRRKPKGGEEISCSPGPSNFINTAKRNSGQEWRCGSSPFGHVLNDYCLPGVPSGHLSKLQEVMGKKGIKSPSPKYRLPSGG